MKSQREPLGWHVTMRLEDGRNLVPGIRERRVLAAAILEAGRDRGLFVFSVPDTHLHVGAAAGREVVGKLAHAVECSLRHRLSLDVPFEPARFTPIRDQGHLGSVVPYILGNGRRHQNLVDLRCEGTNVPDLLGLRVSGLYTAPRVRRLLPRLSRQDLLAHLLVDELRAGTDTALLADAALASLALPELTGRGANQRCAQVAAVHVANELGAGSTATSDLLGLPDRTVRRLRHLKPDPAVVTAIRLQMGLMEDVRDRPIHYRPSAGARLDGGMGR